MMASLPCPASEAEVSHDDRPFRIRPGGPGSGAGRQRRDRDAAPGGRHLRRGRDGCVPPAPHGHGGASLRPHAGSARRAAHLLGAPLRHRGPRAGARRIRLQRDGFWEHWRPAISTSRCPTPPTSWTPWRPIRWTRPASRRARRSRLPMMAPPSKASAAPAGGASAPATSSRWWPPRRAPTASCALSRSARRPRRPPGSTAWSRSPIPKAAVPVGRTTWVTCCACSRASWCTPTWARCSRPTTARAPTPTTTCGASWQTATTRSTTCRTRSCGSKAGSKTRSRARPR